MTTQETTTAELTSSTHIVLVPIRYPLSSQSIQTLEYASQLIHDHDEGTLLILHVDLFHKMETPQRAEIKQAIAPIVGEHESQVILRRGFLVEKVILEEASRLNTDRIAIGKNRKARWRRLLSRLTGNDPAIASYLRENTSAVIDVVE